MTFTFVNRTLGWLRPRLLLLVACSLFVAARAEDVEVAADGVATTTSTSAADAAALAMERAEILAKVRANAWDIEFVKEPHLADPEIMLAAIRETGYLFKYADMSLRRNRTFVIEAVKLSGRALQWAAPEFRADRDIALMAVTTDKSDGSALAHVSEELQYDMDLVMTAVTKNGRALEYASNDTKKNRDVVMTAVTQTGAALEHAWRNMRVDRDVVMTAVSNYGIALKWASDGLKADPQIVLAAVKADCNALQYASEAVTMNPEVMMAVMDLCHDAELVYKDPWDFD